MNEPAVFILADQTLLSVVEQIRDDQWDMVMPAWFQRSPSQQNVTLREIINNHAHDDAWVPAMLAGKTMAEVGAATFDGDLLGADPKASFAAIVAKAVQAATGFDQLDRTVHCSFGDYPAREYFWQINGFRALHARDIAKVIGVNDQLPAELVQGSGRRSRPSPRNGARLAYSGRGSMCLMTPACKINSSP